MVKKYALKIKVLTEEEIRMKQLEHGLQRVAKEVDKRILEHKW